MRRVHAGRYEDGTYGIRGDKNGWQTFRLSNEGDKDGGWMQSWCSLKRAKESIVALRLEEKEAEAQHKAEGLYRGCLDRAMNEIRSAAKLALNDKNGISHSLTSTHAAADCAHIERRIFDMTRALGETEGN